MRLKGIIQVPGDKSISHRAIIFGALATGTTVIDGLLESEDCLHTIEAFKKMGVRIRKENDKYIIDGVGIDGLQEPNDIIDCGNSGTTMRLLMGLLAGQKFYSVLTGDKSLNKRPMARIIDPLKAMKAQIWSRGGLAPISIRGSKLTGIDYTMPIASAQLKSAIILAGLNTEDQTRIKEQASRNHTELMLEKFGVNLQMDDDYIILPQGKKELFAQAINVPGDISSAAFFIVAALITPNSDILIQNLGINPTRTGILDVVKMMGGKYQLDNINNENEIDADLTIEYHPLTSTIIEGKIIPRLIDELPIIALLASQAHGKTIIRDAEELRVKESDRIKTIITEFSKLGIEIEELPDGMIITGPCKLHGAQVSSHGDHRVAMSLLVANIIAKGDVIVDDLECIKTSFPNFLNLLKSLEERRI